MNDVRWRRLVGPLCVALLAPALGGCTEPWSQGILLILIGSLVFLQPPRRSAGMGGFLALAGALLVLAALSFLLPERFGPASWRGALAEAGIPLPGTISPEPWVSLRCWVLLFACLVWAGWLALQDWTLDERRRLVALMAAGVAILAGVSLTAFELHAQVPGWHSARGFGPFPNRNQTADLLAIGGMLAVVCSFEQAREIRLGRRSLLKGQALKALPVIGWLAVAALIIAAILVNYSRAGPVLFTGTLTVWLIVSALFFSRKSVRRAAGAGAAALLFLGAGFLLFGGEAMRRFLDEAPTLGFRGKIFADTLSLIHSSPWCGVGLGCFEGVFPLFRQASVVQERVLHPESDWLWLAAEAGWGGVLIALLLLGLLFTRAFPFAPGTGRRIRFAAWILSLGFAAHGFVDVSGHRPGAVLPALLLLALSAKPQPANSPPGPMPASVRLFRTAGLFLAGAGAVCLAAICFAVPLPGSIGSELMLERAQQQNAHRQFQSAKNDATVAIGWTPLDWRLYFTRGVSNALDGALIDALADFRRARFLEPNFAGLPLEEGRLWVGIAPRFAIPAWKAGLRRLPPTDRAGFYSDALASGYGVPVLRGALWDLAGSRRNLQIVYLSVATPEDFRSRLPSILGQDPDLRSLSADEQRELFGLWVEKGDAGDLASRLAARPEWLANGWRALVRYAESRNDYATCVSISLRFLSPPVLPAPPAMALVEARRRFFQDPGDIAAGLALYNAQTRENAQEDALATLRALAALPGCPRFILYLEGESLARMGKWESGWEALKRYGGKDF